MTRRQLLFTLVLALAAGQVNARADDKGFKIIINPANRMAVVDRDFVRDVFLKKAVEWNDGTTAKPIDLSARFSVREQFTQDVLRKSPAQLKAYWNQQIFSGKGTPPPEADAAADVVSYVLEHAGAIGYVPASADSGKARVIRLD